MGSGKDDIKQVNEMLAREIIRDALLPADVLEKLLQDCNRQGMHLGQSLIKSRCLQVSDLVKLMQSIGGTTVKNPSPKATRAKEGTSPSSRESAGIGKIFGDYQILGEIARGGMGIVYRARQKGIDRVVALKILLSGSLAGTAQVRRFLREAKVIAGLIHANIIPLYSMGEEDGHHYFTMKYVDGGTFEDIIQSDASLEEKINLLIQVCRALDYAHKHKVLHRDLKPSNILIDREHIPYLTDFGLAKVVDSKSDLTQTGTLLGTPFYMSPEQARGIKREIDHRSDIYSMGVILYQILTNTLPFTADVLAELSRKITEEDPLPPRKIVPDVPKALDAICLMAMEKKSGLRYQDAMAMAEDMERYSRGEKVRAQGLRIKARTARCYRRYRGRFALVMFAVALLLAMAVGSYWAFHRGKSKEALQVKAKFDVARAKELFTSGKHRQAIELLKKTDKSVNYRVYLTLACFYRDMEQYPKAREAFKHAYRMAPQEPEVLYEKSVFHQKLGEHKQAITLLDAYLELDRESSNGYRLRAHSLKSLGKEKLSLQDVKRANELEKSLLQRQLDQAIELGEKGQYSAAQEKLDELLAKNPSYEKGYLERGRLYYAKEKYQQALNDISRAIELNPDCEYLALKARWLYHAGYNRRAYRYLTANLAKFPQRSLQCEMLSLIARTALELEKYHNAYDYYLQVLERRVPKARELVAIGHAALEIGKTDEARNYLQKAIDKSLPTEIKGKACYYLGLIFKQRQNDREAIQWWEKALRQNAPQQGDIYLQLGRAFSRLENLSKAISNFKKAAGYFPNNAEVYRGIGNAYLKLVEKGKDKSTIKWNKKRNTKSKKQRKRRKYCKQAIKAFSRGIELEPWKFEDYRQRGNAYSYLKKYDKAERDLLVYQRHCPYDLNVLVKVFDNLFDEGLVLNYYKINILFQNYTYLASRSISPDLFSKDWEKLSSKCFREWSAWKKAEKNRGKWKANEAKILLKSLIESESPAVHEMAHNGLVAMYGVSHLHEMLEGELAKKNRLPSVKRRLERLAQKLDNRRRLDLKIEFRQLLLRYYRTYESLALMGIYEHKERGNLCLESMLGDTKESSMIRLLAARALRDLCMQPARRILERNWQEGDFVTRLFCNVALKKPDFSEKASGDFNKSIMQLDSYAKTVAMPYFRKSHRDLVRKLLKDPKIEVRLCAAGSLIKYGNSRAENILLDACGSKDPLLRAYAIWTFWDSSNLTKNQRRKFYVRSQSKLSVLLNALQDENAQVRRAAVLRLGEVGGKKQGENIARLLNDQDQSIRFQVINSLAKNMNIDLIMPVMLDSKEPLPFRLTVINGLTVATREGGDVPPTTFLGLTGLLEDPDPRIRMAIVASASRLGDGRGTMFMKSFVQQHKSDPAVRAGHLFGIMTNPLPKYLPIVMAFLDDKDLQVRCIAAGASIQLAKEFDLPELDDVHRRIMKKSPAVRKAGAAGYAKLVDDRFSKKFKGDEVVLDMGELYRHYVEKLVKKAKKDPEISSGFADLYTRAIDLDPDNAKYWFERGIVRYVQGNFRKSCKDIEKAIKLAEEDIYRSWLTRAYFQSGQYRKAIEISEKFPHIFRLSADLCRLKGDILKALGEREKASICYDDARLMEEK